MTTQDTDRIEHEMKARKECSWAPGLYRTRCRRQASVIIDVADGSPFPLKGCQYLPSASPPIATCTWNRLGLYFSDQSDCLTNPSDLMPPGFTPCGEAESSASKTPEAERFDRELTARSDRDWKPGLYELRNGRPACVLKVDYSDRRYPLKGSFVSLSQHDRILVQHWNNLGLYNPREPNDLTHPLDLMLTDSEPYVPTLSSDEYPKVVIHSQLRPTIVISGREECISPTCFASHQDLGVLTMHLALTRACAEWELVRTGAIAKIYHDSGLFFERADDGTIPLRPLGGALIGRYPTVENLIDVIRPFPEKSDYPNYRVDLFRTPEELDEFCRTHFDQQATT